MKITTRITAGYGLCIAILAALAIYEGIAIHGMQAINRSLSGIGIRNAGACLEASREWDLVAESTRKLFAAPADPDCSKELQESQRAFDARLREIKTSAESTEELAEVQRLSQLWDASLAEQKSLLPNPPKSGNALPERLQESLDAVRVQTLSVYQAALRSMSSNAEKSRKTGETAALVLYCAALIAFAISILVSFLIVRSISKPLASLTEGTRALAEGKFYYRLDSSGNDELAQLAKDFNSLTHRLNELEKQK
jgi:nitrate/nitrite-specific signal transduction histidine kinase